MAENYTIRNSSNEIVATIKRGQFDESTTSLVLIGKKFPDWGQYINSNFVKLLENFASNTPPVSPLRGQIWYDTSGGTNSLKIYDGTQWDAILENRYTIAYTGSFSGNNLSGTKTLKRFNNLVSDNLQSFLVSFDNAKIFSVSIRTDRTLAAGESIRVYPATDYTGSQIQSERVNPVLEQGLDQAIATDTSNLSDTELTNNTKLYAQANLSGFTASSLPIEIVVEVTISF